MLATEGKFEDRFSGIAGEENVKESVSGIWRPVWKSEYNDPCESIFCIVQQNRFVEYLRLGTRVINGHAWSLRGNGRRLWGKSRLAERGRHASSHLNLDGNEE